MRYLSEETMQRIIIKKNSSLIISMEETAALSKTIPVVVIRDAEIKSACAPVPSVFVVIDLVFDG